MSDTLPGGRTAPPEPQIESPAEEPESAGAVPASNADTDPDMETPAQTAPVAGREAVPDAEPVPRPGPGPVFVPEAGPVFAPESAQSFRVRWSSIQAGFIDDPRNAVQDADRFVADVVQSFTAGVEARRRALTSAWEQDGHSGTEELRLTMRQYRALVDRILLG